MTRSIFLYFLFAINFSATSQIRHAFNRLSTDNGLNTNVVKCIWQDKKGFLWVGTQSGIQRFDGHKFINFRSDGEGDFLPPFGVDQILDAGNNKLWVRQNNLIGMFDPISFHYNNVPIETSKPFLLRDNLKLFRDSRGNTFLCVSRYGLLWYDPNQKKFTEDNLPIKVPDEWPVSSLFEDTDNGEYWISSIKGLAVYNSQTGALTYFGNNPQKNPLFDKKISNVINFFIDKEENYWIEYWKYDTSHNRAEIIHYNSQENQISKNILNYEEAFFNYYQLDWIFESKKGEIWVGGLNALLNYDLTLRTLKQYKTAISDDYGIKCRVVNQMYEDHEGNIWLCTDNGLYILTPGKSVFNYFFNTKVEGSEIIANSILETKDYQNWIGTWGRGIFKFDSFFRPMKVDLYKSISKKEQSDFFNIWDLCQHSKTELIWVGCQSGALAIFHPNEEKPIALLRPPVFKGSTVRKIIEDSKGNLFFGTQSGLIVKWEYGTEISNKNFKVIHDLNTIIYTFYKDKKKRIWVGTQDKGAYVLDSTGEKQLYHFNEKLFKEIPTVGSTAYDIEQLNDSIFFVANGFLQTINLNSGKIKTFTQYEGLPGTSVTHILLDDHGVLWFTHNEGLGSYTYEKNMFVSYGKKDGLLIADKSKDSKLKMKNGELWFGGENALFGFDPEGLKSKKAPPNVTLTDFKLLNEYIPIDSLLTKENIYFRPEQNSFAIYFSSLSYTQQDKLLYYYKLDGIDNDWVKVENELAAYYTTLSPGKYTFNVKCVNMQGIESTNITSLSFAILPHFYQTWWFLAIVFLTIANFIYFLYKQRINKLLAVERIRTKVARDLHDDIGSTLSTINILSSMAKSKMNTDPVKTSSYISKITDNSQQMMEAMDDIVWSIKPDNDSMQKIVARMREYVSGILEPKEIEISFDVNDRVLDLRLNMEARRDVFLIFKEAVNNIAKYSQCTKARIDLRYQNHQLTMIIKDNGKGFELNKADTGNGLGNMKKRAEALHGKIEIKSQEGLGTEVALNIPITT